MDLLIWALFLTVIKNGVMTDELSTNSGTNTVSSAPAKAGKKENTGLWEEKTFTKYFNEKMI